MKYRVTSENKEKIVSRLKEAGVAYWEVAEAMGCHHQTVYNRMRNPTDEFTAEVLRVIDGLANGE